MILAIRLLLFTSLPGGGWLGSIQSQQRMGGWELQVTQMLIANIYPFWQTVWFLLLVLTGLVSSGFWMVRSWNQQRRLRLELVRRELEIAELREMDTAKSQFYANVTHEFRTPLTIILNANEQLASTRQTQQQQQQTEIIRRHAQQLIRLITETLDMARLDAGKLKPFAQLGDPLAFISEVVVQFRGLAGQSGINLTYNADEQIAPVLPNQPDNRLYSFDSDKWEKIAYNLLANALKFTPAGGSVHVTGRISRRDCFVLRVADTGIGIPNDEMARIFERFHQVDANSTRPNAGTGIGLALVRELTDWLGGSVSVESEPGLGSVLTVELPLVPQGSGESMSSEPGRPQSHPATEMPAHSIVDSRVSGQRSGSASGIDKPLVLVVDDNADLLAQLTDFLSAEYRVISNQNGRLALERALAEVPDLILSDVMMADLDGYELVERLKADERTSHIPVILLTARSSPDSRIKGLQVGADDLLGKPFSLTELALRIGNGLRTRQNWQKQFLAHPVLATSVPTPESDREARFLSRLHQSILDHIELETLDVDWLASQAGMSRTQLHRKLTALTNLSPNRFIHRVRLERASELLQAGELNVAQVAYQVGYNSQSYFAKVFQDHFGYSPAKLKGPH